jgi:hypothetical protein
VIGASKIKNGLTMWLCALIVTLSLGETCVGKNLAATSLELGQIATTTQTSTSDFYDASQYDASGYAVAPKTTTVGRWMGDVEHAAMMKNKTVQAPLNGANATHVTVPPNASAFKPPPQSPNFVEFDVPSSQLNIHDVGNGWGRVFGPGSLEARLAASKGLPVPPAMPPATNIRITKP